MRQPRPRGVEYAGRRSFSPKVRLPKKGSKKFLARNLYEETNIQFDYESGKYFYFIFLVGNDIKFLDNVYGTNGCLQTLTDLICWKKFPTNKL